MSTQGYEEELRCERSYVAGLYTRLDAERARVKAEYDAALRGNGGTSLERDVQVRTLATEVRRLDVADNGLCFGARERAAAQRGPRGVTEIVTYVLTERRQPGSTGAG